MLKGVTINRKKTPRLYEGEGPAVRQRRSHKRSLGSSTPAPVLALPDQRWGLDFVHDQVAFGRLFRMRNLVYDVRGRACNRCEISQSPVAGLYVS